MAINKIVLNTDSGEQVLVDLTGDNVTADALVVGHTAHGADGETVAGRNPYEKTATDAEVQTQTTQIGTNAALIQQIKTALEGKAAGGGSGGESVETCMVRVEDSSRSSTYKYTNEGQELETVGPGSYDTTLTVMKNSYMYVAGGAGSLQVTGNASIEYGYTNRFVILITGDAGVSFAYNVDPT